MSYYWTICVKELCPEPSYSNWETAFDLVLEFEASEVCRKVLREGEEVNIVLVESVGDHKYAVDSISGRIAEVQKLEENRVRVKVQAMF